MIESRDMSSDCGLQGPLRAWRLRRLGPHRALDVRPVPPRPAPLERGRVGHPPGARILTIGGATEAELARIRGICGELGADAEMTVLVLASHRHDRGLLDVMLSEGGDLRDYVRRKLAIWEAILDTDEGPWPDRSPDRGSSWAERA
jgi:hypothetical protein